MNILFVHQNFPAQFGHVAEYLSEKHGHQCSFVSRLPSGKAGNIERIQYQLEGGATEKSHYCSRTFENATWHSHAVFKALKARPDVRPDLIVGHSGFGSTIFLRELYDCPIVNYFEYFYRPQGSDMDFRPDFPSNELNRLRARTRNAMILLDLENCNIGYSPTRFQKERLPAFFHDKVKVVFDGVDTRLWRRYPEPERKIKDQAIPDDMHIVTYSARGFESMRGFDIFMKAAQKLAERRSDVLFVVVGEDRVCYGGDDKITGQASFKNWVLSQGSYDLSRFLFTGLLPPYELARLFSMTDLHFYLTVPFVLSWSMLDALSCGAVVLASDTEPVREVIENDRNGLLVDFFDVDGMVERAEQVLNDLPQYRRLGDAGTELIARQYSVDVCLPQLIQVFDAARARSRKQ